MMNNITKDNNSYNTFIVRESQLGYTSKFFKLNTSAPLDAIDRYNKITHRADWVNIGGIVEGLESEGYFCEYEELDLDSSDLDDYITLRYGNY